MRDAAGDSGEFYTPRAVVRFMVEVTDPRLGETRPRPGLRHRRVPRRVLRPPGKAVQDRAGQEDAAGEEHLRRRGQAAALHAGADEPAAARAGLPRHRLRQQPGREADRDRRQGPGGRDPDQSALRRRGGAGHPDNFPADKQTAETALLFLQLIMRKLQRRRAEAAAGPASSCPTARSSATASAPGSSRSC